MSEVLLFPGKAAKTAPSLGLDQSIPNMKLSTSPETMVYYDLNESDMENKTYTEYFSSMTVRQVLMVNLKVLDNSR